MHLEEGLEFSFRMTLWRNRGYTLFCNVKWRIIFSQDAKTGICRGTGSNVPTNTSGGASTPADIRHCNHLNLLILRVLKRYFRKKDNFNNFFGAMRLSFQRVQGGDHEEAYDQCYCQDMVESSHQFTRLREV